MFKFAMSVGGAALALCPAVGADAPTEGPRVETFSGWENSLVLSGGDAKAVIVPSAGGRIMHYSLNGANILYNEPGSGGKTLASTPEGFAVGGYQCGLGPELRAVPDHRLLLLGPQQWKSPRPYVVSLQSGPDAAVGIQLEKEIVVAPDSGEIGLQQRMKNVSSGETGYCLWDRTQCKGGGFAFFPLNRKSHFKAGWALRKEVNGKLAYDGEKPSDPRVRVMDGVLVVQTKGPPLKLGADSEAGWIAYTEGRVLFVKYYPFILKGNYAEFGNSVELSCDQQLTSLEILSPEARLKPGETYSFPEKWVLHDLDKPAGSFAEVRALVKRVSPSPFKK